MTHAADTEPQRRPRLVAGAAAAGATAVGTLAVSAASLLVRAASPDPATAGLLWLFGMLTSSFAVLGLIAAAGNFLTGYFRAAYPINPEHPARWTFTTALFIVLAVPVLVYASTGAWLTNGLLVALSTLLCTLTGGIVFVLLWPAVRAAQLRRTHKRTAD